MIRWIALALAGCTAASPLDALERDAPRLDPKDLPANIDKIVKAELKDAPSAVVAAVVDGKVVYVHAYGQARLDPPTPAATTMRYSIGSISKQFTTAALLLLAEDGKLSIDDKVGKYVPGLTRGDDITLRQLLSHTSGYPDYAPQDYMIPAWEKPIEAHALLDQWAKRPLEFEPGTKWQYSNTNYVLAGLVVEQVAGVPLFDFLTQRIFKPLAMTSVTNTDRAKLTEPDAQGYFQRALGPLHPAPHEGPGWMAGAGELAMTAEDLAKWDIAMMNEAVLSPASWRQLETEVALANGAGTRYGLGTGVGLWQGHRELSHGGEVSGFVASSYVLPDDKIAVVVLVNQDAIDTNDVIADKVKRALIVAQNAPSATADRAVAAMLADLAAGRVDRAKITDNLAAYFSPEAIAEYAHTLGSLGAPRAVEQTRSSKRGGMTYRGYTAKYDDKSLSLSVYETPDGKLEQFLITSE